MSLCATAILKLIEDQGQHEASTYSIQEIELDADVVALSTLNLRAVQELDGLQQPISYAERRKNPRLVLTSNASMLQALPSERPRKPET